MGMLDQKICVADDCDRKPKARQLCMKHYMRNRKHGSPEVTLVPQEQHGHYETPEYRAWLGMKRRCYYSSDKAYSRYGGRGIKVCDKWLNSFSQFYADMGSRPSQTHSLDRIDNDGDYSPQNCRWATKQEQVLNRRPKQPGQSGYYGVDLPKNCKGFKVSINCLRIIYVGSFESAEEAAWMYDQWAMQLHGELATLNFEYV